VDLCDCGVAFHERMVDFQDCEMGVSTFFPCCRSKYKPGMDAQSMGILCEMKRKNRIMLSRLGSEYEAGDIINIILVIIISSILCGFLCYVLFTIRFYSSGLVLEFSHREFSDGSQRFFLYNSPPQFRNLAAACSGVISRCGSAIS